MRIEIYDSRNTTIDRYTVLIDDAAFGMSSNANDANGFNQYIGPAAIMPVDLGEPVRIGLAPRGVLAAILYRIKAED